jgi:hypothetical protein
VSQKERTGVLVAKHNIDPDFVSKTVQQLSVKEKLSESENENGSNAIRN